MNSTASPFEVYSDIYLTHVFTTLGQLTAVVLSGTIAVPMYTFYSRRLNNYYTKKYT